MIKYFPLFLLLLISAMKIPAQTRKANPNNINRISLQTRENKSEVLRGTSNKNVRSPKLNERVKKFTSRDGELRIDKITKKKTRKSKFQKKKKNVEIENNIEPIFEEIVPRPSRIGGGYCTVIEKIKSARRYVTISHEEFPLRIEDASIDYYGTLLRNNNMKDIFEFEIEVEAFSDIYFDEFAMLIEYFDGTKQNVIFNTDEVFFELYSKHTFTKTIEVQRFGYVNLRIGYYDECDDIFYVTESLPNRTDFVYYITKTQEKILNRKSKW